MIQQGTIIGGIIGTDIIRFDLYGENVVIANKMESGGDSDKINVSEDSWFGDSLAPHQRLDMARMRALENGRPMIRAGNSGISAVVDHEGTVIARTPQFERTVLLAEVQPTKGVNPYVVFGSSPVVALCILVIVAGWFVRTR